MHQNLSVTILETSGKERKRVRQVDGRELGKEQKRQKGPCCCQYLGHDIHLGMQGCLCHFTRHVGSLRKFLTPYWRVLPGSHEGKRKSRNGLWSAWNPEMLGRIVGILSSSVTLMKYDVRRVNLCALERTCQLKSYVL